MSNQDSSVEHEYACADCKKKGAGRYIAGGWWQYPLGWFVHDDAERWACSLACVRRLSSAPPPKLKA